MFDKCFKDRVTLFTLHIVGILCYAKNINYLDDRIQLIFNEEVVLERWGITHVNLYDDKSQYYGTRTIYPPLTLTHGDIFDYTCEIFI